MSTLLIILLIISVPVFYILGAIDFIKTILGKKSLNEDKYLETIIKEISAYTENHPNAKASDLLHYFKNQLKRVESNKEHIVFEEEKREKHEVIIPNDSKPQEEIFEESHSIHQKNSRSHTNPDFWQNWYSENSINLLLYVGAFFIVASASIFVGFQWDSIQSQIKAILLTLLTLSFFVSGSLFYKNPKVQNAGITFIAIGALLIPLTGIGWHNFVLKNLGISVGLTWLITSAIALVIYVILGLYFRNKFYGYITSLAVWSLSLSSVSLLELDPKFYILASIISNFLLLIFHILIRTKTDEQLHKTFSEPLEISTNILMPLTIFYDLQVALFSNMFPSIEVASSLFLASCYYYLFYSFSQRLWQLAAALTLFPLFLISLFGW